MRYNTVLHCPFLAGDLVEPPVLPLFTATLEAAGAAGKHQCTAPHHIPLHCTVLYYTVLHCTVYCIQVVWLSPQLYPDSLQP